jgi:hypothetical protein
VDKSAWATDWWAWSDIISIQISNSPQICKLKKEVFPYSKNIKILHGARLESYEQVSQLG